MTSPLTILAPGRVNLLGEHVDYNGGPVLPVAIDRSVRLEVKPREDQLVYLNAADLKQSTVLDLERLSAKLDAKSQPLPGWARYPAGVAWSLQGAGLRVSGMEARYTSTIPMGAGLSSSAAVEMAFATAWKALGNWDIPMMDLIRLAQQAERHYVGANVGIMDQFASAMGVKDHALYFDTRTFAWEAIPLPSGSAIIIADSGVHHSHAQGEYNKRRADTERAVELLRPFFPGIKDLRDVSPADFLKYCEVLPEPVRKHARHVVEEIARVEEAVGYLKQGNTLAFGELMYAGHASMRDLFEASAPEVDKLVEIARQLPGVWGARITGGGFGGSTVNLVEERKAGSIIRGLKAGYQKATGREAQVYLCHASQGAHVVE